MWLEAAVHVVGLLWPFGRGKPVEPSVMAPGASILRVQVGDPRAYVDGLNASGWLAHEVLAAGVLRQGRPYSLFGLVTGLALIDWVRARRAKSLPREFVLAVTAHRVIAFALSLLAEGGADEWVETFRIKRGARGCWPRHLVRVIDQSDGFSSKGATLEVGGGRRVPIAWDSDSSTDELIELLSR